MRCAAGADLLLAHQDCLEAEERRKWGSKRQSQSRGSGAKGGYNLIEVRQTRQPAGFDARQSRRRAVTRAVSSR